MNLVLNFPKPRVKKQLPLRFSEQKAVARATKPFLKRFPENQRKKAAAVAAAVISTF